MRTLKSRSLTFMCLLLMLTAAGRAAAGAPAPSAPPPVVSQPATTKELTPKQIYQQCLHATAWVYNPGKGTGTGWLVDRASKLLVTNHHVVEDSDAVLVFFPVYREGKPISEQRHYLEDERPIRGRIVDSDSRRDLAIIQLETLPAEAQALKLAAESTSPSERAHVIGNPGASRGLWVYSSGTVRVLARLHNRFRTGQEIDAQGVEYQIPTNPGDSGSAVVNDSGEVVAVHSMGTPEGAQLMSSGIDVTELHKYLAEVRKLMNPRTAADFNDRGNNYCGKGRYDRAVADYTASIRIDPDVAIVYSNRAGAFYFKRDYDTAIADCNEAIRRDPHLAMAHCFRGSAYSRKGQHDQAIADLTEAIRHDGSLAVAYNNRGLAYDNKGKTELAIRDFSEAIRLDRNMAVAYTNRGLSYSTQREFDRAIADYTEALKLNPIDAVAYHGLGLALRSKGQLERALEQFEMALKIEPRNPVTWYERGVTFLAMNKLDDAITHYTVAIRLYDKYAYAYCSRAFAYEAKGDLARAEADYNKAVELDEKLANLVPLKHSRFLKLVNNTGEPLLVYLQYEAKADDGKWYWYPAKGGPLSYELAPGQATNLKHDQWQIHARRVRVWAEGKTSGKEWLRAKDKDLWIAPQDGYRLNTLQTYTYTFHP